MRPVINDPEAEGILEKLVQVTGCGNPSTAICMVVKRYGPWLIQWWQSNPHTTATESLTATELPPPTLDPGENLPPLEL
jgi:hypothetical protein